MRQLRRQRTNGSVIYKQVHMEVDNPFPGAIHGQYRFDTFLIPAIQLLTTSIRLMSPILLMSSIVTFGTMIILQFILQTIMNAIRAFNVITLSLILILVGCFGASDGTVSAEDTDLR